MGEALEGERDIEPYLQILTCENKRPVSAIPGVEQLLQEERPGE